MPGPHCLHREEFFSVHDGKMNLQHRGPAQVHPAASVMFDPAPTSTCRVVPHPKTPAHSTWAPPRPQENPTDPVLISLVGWHSQDNPGGNYKAPFTWGISRCFANIESLIPPSGPLKLAGIGGAEEGAEAAVQGLGQGNAVTTSMTWLIYLANWV